MAVVLRIEDLPIDCWITDIDPLVQGGPRPHLKSNFLMGQFDAGKLTFDRSYLESVIKAQGTFIGREVMENSLRFDLAHELMHFHESLENPEAAKQSAQKIEEARDEDRILAWFESGTEVRCQRFALEYIKTRKTYGWKDFLGKVITWLDKSPSVP